MRSRGDPSTIEVYSAEEIARMDPDATPPPGYRPERDRPEPKTKPNHVSTKHGTTGKNLELRANYFRFDVAKADIKFYQYHVAMTPEVDVVQMRRQLLRNSFRQQFGDQIGFIFDAQAALYTTHQIGATVTLRIDHGENPTTSYEIVMRNTNPDAITISDQQKVQIFNTLLRRTMNELKLQQVGRNLYDPRDSKKIPNLKLELWPGYITSIRKHESNFLVNVDLSHKVMRDETVHNVLARSRQAGGDYQTRARQEIVGKIVMTQYNNETYRIDDIDFDRNPSQTFESRGQQITYQQYYQNRYQVGIKDATQPLLIVNPSARDIRGGRIHAIHVSSFRFVIL